MCTLERVNWFNHRRLLKLIDNIPLAKAEDQYHALANPGGAYILHCDMCLAASCPSYITTLNWGIRDATSCS
jgi:hypothetical protein